MASKLRCTDRDAANYGRMFWFKGKVKVKVLLGGGGEMYFGGVRHVYYINYGMISISKETGKPLDLPFV